MRNYFFIIVSLLFFFKKIDAQTNVYHPFPDSSALWNEESWSIYPGTSDVHNPQIEFFGGDTIISTLHYKKIRANGYQYNISFPNQPCCNYVNRYLGAMRQDSVHKKVYFCNASTTKDTLLYDFDLHVGDTLPLSFINPSVANYVSSIDSILIGATYRKQYHISVRGSTSNSQDSNYVSLIEGIGSTFGLLYQLAPPFEAGSTLNCFNQNNTTLYPNTTYSCSSTVSIKDIKNNSSLVIYPNPAQNNFIIETNVNDKQTLQIFDVNGKLVLTQTINGTTNIDASTLAQGVYNVSLTSNESVVNKRLVIVK